MNIAVIRFSSLGDVALTSPVISSILNNNKEVNIWLVTNPNFKALFEKNDRLHFINTDLYKKHKGVFGLQKLVTEITNETKIDVVVDLHDVLRTKLIRFFFKLKGVETITFNKGRKEKKKLLTGEIPFQPLPHITVRYSKAFATIVKDYSINKEFKLLNTINSPIQLDMNTSTIGIAPYAAHKSKEWGDEKIDQLIKSLSNKNILLLGGKDESTKLESIAKKYNHCKSIAGKYNLGEELKIIANLSLIICMDSANMHLASLTQTPVISIWGPTHHYLGFGPLNDTENIVEIPKEKMPCRPCSVYGKVKSNDQKECAKKSMEKITVQQVLDKVDQIINAH